MHAKQPRHRLSRALVVAALTVGISLPSVALAQTSPRLDLGGMIEVGGEEERYLRALQIAGVVPLTPWSIQPFSPTQVGQLRSAREHPWAGRYVADSARFIVLRPRERLVENTAFPYQTGNGPTWEGKGLTGEVQLGVAGVLGPLHMQLAPLAFAAQNSAFALADNGETGNGVRGDPRFPTQIDLPQRFGTHTYSRATFGTSAATLDFFHVLAGVGTAPQKWGPEVDFPLVLGPNAGGFPMIFLGTSTPANLWLFKVHTRLVYGRLTQSSEFQSTDSTRVRFGSGIVFSITPRGMDGLEIGAARFIHRFWPNDFTFAEFKRPFSAVSDSHSAQNDPRENQLGSVFFRWAFPKNRLEVFGEIYREDYPGTFHEDGASLIEAPDDLLSFALGLQRAWTSSSNRLRAVHIEIVNGEINHQQRDARGFTRPLPPYIHGGATQGHTFDGMLLGSQDAYDGSGWRFGYDEFTPQGRRSLTLERTLRLDWLPSLPEDHPQVRPEVLYALRAEWTRFVGRRDFTLAVIPGYDLNRYLVGRHDVFNLALSATVRGW